jgi:hypothetical protein
MPDSRASGSPQRLIQAVSCQTIYLAYSFFWSAAIWIDTMRKTSFISNDHPRRFLVF